MCAFKVEVFIPARIFLFDNFIASICESVCSVGVKYKGTVDIYCLKFDDAVLSGTESTLIAEGYGLFFTCGAGFEAFYCNTLRDFSVFCDWNCCDVALGVCVIQ